MPELVIICEGQTEEQFVKRVLAPSLRPSGVFAKPELVETSPGHRGGGLTFDRLKLHARNTLRRNPTPMVTTFLDLYALDTNFPAFDEAKRLADVFLRLDCLESALHNAIVVEAGCRPDRFIPYIQPHEFEGLLFSGVDALVSLEEGWTRSRDVLISARDDHDSPEHINDGYDTKPSARLEKELEPKYRKKWHGPLAAERITLATMERECAHFRSWIERLRALPS